MSRASLLRLVTARIMSLLACAYRASVVSVTVLLCLSTSALQSLNCSKHTSAASSKLVSRTQIADMSFCRLWPVKQPAAQSMEEALPNDVKGPRLYPVSILWEPPFTMLVHLVGHGSLQVSLSPSVIIAAMSCCLR